MQITARFILYSTCALTLATLPLRGAGSWLAGASQLKGAAIPVYLTNQARASATIRIETVSRGYQRRGFFRIGVLPIAVGDGVRFDVHQPEHIAEVLASGDDLLRSLAGLHGAELRRTAVVLPEQALPLFEAGRVVLAPRGRWELTDGIIVCTGVNTTIRLRRAMLQVAGPGAGQLQWQSEHGPCALNLFAGPESVQSERSTQKTKGELK